MTMTSEIHLIWDMCVDEMTKITIKTNYYIGIIYYFDYLIIGVYQCMLTYGYWMHVLCIDCIYMFYLLYIKILL